MQNQVLLGSILGAVSYSEAQAVAHPRVQDFDTVSQYTVKYAEGTMQVAEFGVSNGDADFNLLLSTAKSYSAIAGPQCGNCGEKKIMPSDFQATNATVYEIEGAIGPIASAELEMEYSSGSVNGRFDFVAATSFDERIPSQSQGYIGLARGSEIYATGPSMAKQLVDQGVTDSDVVSFAFGGGSQLSKVTWGGYDEGDINGLIQWISQDDNQVYWKTQTGVSAISYDDNAADWTPEYAYGEQYTKQAYFDTGNTFIKPPTDVAADLIRHLVKGKPHAYSEEENLVLVFCSDSYPSFKLLIDDYYFQVREEDYKVQITEPKLGYDCYLTIQLDKSGSQDYWVLGQTFMQGFVTIFDNDMELLARVGIAKLEGDTKAAIKLGFAPSATVLDIQPEMDQESSSLSNTVNFMNTANGGIGKLVYSDVGGKYSLNLSFQEYSSSSDDTAEDDAGIIALIVLAWIGFWVGIEDFFNWLFGG